MQYSKRQIVLRDGRLCVIRNPGGADAAAILNHLIRTSGETEYMLRGAEEITMTEEQEQIYLEEQERDPLALMICGEVDGTIVANAGIYPAASLRRTRHRAEFGISIRREYWGLGIGSALLGAILEAAGNAGYAQAELEVVAENTRAQALYRRFGFETYGVRPDTFRYEDGHTAAAYLMLRTLEPSGSACRGGKGSCRP